MSKTSLPLIAFALLAHFHTSPFFAMFLLIVATLNSPANYFLALYAQSLSVSVYLSNEKRTRTLNLTVTSRRLYSLGHPTYLKEVFIEIQFREFEL